MTQWPNGEGGHSSSIYALLMWLMSVDKPGEPVMMLCCCCCYVLAQCSSGSVMVVLCPGSTAMMAACSLHIATWQDICHSICSPHQSSDRISQYLTKSTLGSRQSSGWQCGSQFTEPDWNPMGFSSPCGLRWQLQISSVAALPIALSTCKGVRVLLACTRISGQLRSN